MGKMKKVTAIIVPITTIVLILCVIYFVNIKDKKGGKDAHTMFDVNTNEVAVSYHENTVSLKHEEQKAFLKIVKDICKEEDTSIDKNIDYDMIIDFKNGNKASVSTEDKVLCVNDQGIVKKITDDNMDKLYEYIK